MIIRPFEAADWAILWPMLRDTFAAGDSYPFTIETSQADVREIWIARACATFVACDATGRVVGTCCLKPNQPGRGAHVCNASYVVAPEARGQGIAARLCEHSQVAAIALGFRAMQFNLVVSTNRVAVRLWQKLGFEIVGTLPGAFAHRELGFVDAFVMFKSLAP